MPLSDGIACFIARMGVGPVEPDAPGELLDDPPILPRVAGHRQRGATHLHLPVGVGDGAVLFRPGRGRQHDIGVFGGLGQEQILHYQMFELGEGRPGMLDIGVGHRRVLAHDVHALDLPGMDRVHDLDHGQAALRVEARLPQPLELAAHIRVLDRLVVGIEHRDQRDIGGALHVVLAAQRVQPGAGPADLAGDQCQRDQAARIVGAVDMLRDAHAPEDDRRFGAGVGPRHLAQGRRVDAADLVHLLRRVVADVFAQRLEVLGMSLDVLPVIEAFLDDRV